MAVALAVNPVALTVPTAWKRSIREARVGASGAPPAVNAFATVVRKEVGVVADTKASASVALIAPAVSVAQYTGDWI